MPIHQAQLEHLCDQAMREERQEKLRKLMDQILRLLSKQQKDSREVSTGRLVVAISEENTSCEKLYPQLVAMPCKSCGSLKQSKFTAEIAIHFPGLKNIDKPVVRVFPKISVCLDCGGTEFAVPEVELRLLAKGDGAAAGQ